jgi:hypothetical protein
MQRFPKADSSTSLRRGTHCLRYTAIGKFYSGLTVFTQAAPANEAAPERTTASAKEQK